ncbi:hypothetical protein ACHOLT_15335 [Desulfitobacterium sp. Sab5]|uniref:hypothetical protein n=1 Tax=Desulfitobacterium nosdiversum TaxID=3375356 RepID=UPI003CF0B928
MNLTVPKEVTTLWDGHKLVFIMNFILDTNAFYHYYGRKKLGLQVNEKVNLIRLNAILSSNNSIIAISTVTIIEFLVHFRDKPAIVKDVLRFVILRRINIIPFGISEFGIENVAELLRLSDATLKIRIDYYKKAKIKTESAFAATFLLLLLKVYINFYLEREEKINAEFRALPEKERDKRKSEVFGLLLSNDIEKSLKDCNSAFAKVLRKGYAIKDEEKSLKDAFNNALYSYCAVFSLFIDFFIQHYNVTEFTSEKFQSEYQKTVANNSDFNILKKNPNHISGRIKEIIREFEKETASGFIRRHRQDIIDNWKGDLFSSSQAEYIGRLFEKWYLRGSKYDKNDVLDMMILQALDIKDCLLITFDETMQDYAFEIGHPSIEYIKRVYDRRWPV